jgi:alpha-tubulin suppressor-like RCC1 family protein
VSPGPLAVASKLAVSGLNACALRPDGIVVCWGASGGNGDGSQVNRLSPVFVSGLDGVTSISAGAAHHCALRKDGSVWCWGNGSQGQTASPIASLAVTPTQVAGLPLPAIGVGAHEGNHTCALLSDTSVWCFGANEAGQLGDGTITTRYVPTPMKLN